MNASNFPRTDSIQELAEFWDAHDVTDFTADLEEVSATVFEHEVAIGVPLEPADAQAVAQIARSEGTDPGNLIRQWVIERIHASG